MRHVIRNSLFFQLCLTVPLSSAAMARPQAVLVNGSAPAPMNYCECVLAIEQAVKFLGWRFETHAFSGDTPYLGGPPNSVRCPNTAMWPLEETRPLVRHIPKTGLDGGARRNEVFAAIDAAALALATARTSEPFLLYFQAHGGPPISDDTDFEFTLWDSTVTAAELRKKIMEVHTRIPDSPLILLLDVCFSGGILTALFEPVADQPGKLAPLPGSCGFAIAGPDESALIIQLMMAELEALAKQPLEIKKVDTSRDGLIAPAELAAYLKGRQGRRATATLTSDVFLRLLLDGKLASRSPVSGHPGAPIGPQAPPMTFGPATAAAERLAAERVGAQVLPHALPNYEPKTVAHAHAEITKRLAKVRAGMKLTWSARTAWQLRAIDAEMQRRFGTEGVKNFLQDFKDYVADCKSVDQLKLRAPVEYLDALDDLVFSLGDEIPTTAGLRSFGELLDAAAQLYRTGVPRRIRAARGLQATWAKTGDAAQTRLLALQDQLEGLGRVKAAFDVERAMKALRAAGPGLQAEYGELLKCEGMGIWKLGE